MALKDLVASKSALTEEAIELVVKDYVRYDPDEMDIAFTPAFATLGNRAKVLVYLVAVQGWSFVSEDAITVETRPANLEEKLGIPGGTLRPLLKDLKDRHLIVSKGDGYTVRAANLDAIQREMEARPADASVRRGSKPAKRRKLSAVSSATSDDDQSSGGSVQKKRKNGSGDIKQVFAGWIRDGLFDTSRTLADVQAKFHEEAIMIPRTSIPSYLLGAVRDRSLSRSKQEVNGKQVWVYQTKRHG